MPPPAFGATDWQVAERRSGKLHDQFVVNIVQGGAGTSTNKNAGAVISSGRALLWSVVPRLSGVGCQTN